MYAWQEERPLVLKQYTPEMFFKYVCMLIGKEFNAEFYYIMKKNSCIFRMFKYIVQIEKEEVERLQYKKPYALDKYLLEELKKQGLAFDINKSTYIECCYYEDEKKEVYDKNNTDLKFSEKFNISIPEGGLFYPCCGEDSYEPLYLFMDIISEFHFADSNKIILPHLECGVRRTSEERNSLENNIGTFNSKDVPFAVAMFNNKNFETMKSLEDSLLMNLEFIKFSDISNKEIWKTKYENNKKIEVYTHKYDGFLGIMSIEKISVFYYRGRNNRNKNAAFNWFEEIAFNTVLDKLQDGGIIVTDGINPNEKDKDKSVIWNVLWKNENISFNYKNRKFSFIGEIGRLLKVWKVEKIVMKMD